LGWFLAKPTPMGAMTPIGARGILVIVKYISLFSHHLTKFVGNPKTLIFEIRWFLKTSNAYLCQLGIGWSWIQTYSTILQESDHLFLNKSNHETYHWNIVLILNPWRIMDVEIKPFWRYLLRIFFILLMRVLFPVSLHVCTCPNSVMCSPININRQSNMGALNTKPWFEVGPSKVATLYL
jgi:hypothetical protein